MRDHSKHVELSREDAMDAMLAALNDDFGFVTGKSLHTERIPLSESFSRILAEDVFSQVDMPSALTCCMDSVALRWSDFENLAPAEIPDTSEWTRGVQWEFANTGIAMPAGFDTAIVIEHVEVSEDEQHITIKAAPSKQYAGTRPAGSSMHAGEQLAHAGCIITPDVAARIASGNHASVNVVCKPRVVFIPTGNELITPGFPCPEKGKNFETNSFVVRGKVEAWGGTFVPFDVVPDVPEKISEAVKKACTLADIVVLNAGSSKGSDDWSVEQLEEVGQIICHQTNHAPGHHSSFAIVDETPIVGISGPAGGASTTLNLYLLPLIKKFLGQDPAPQKVAAVMKEDFPPSKHKLASEEKNLPGEQRPSVVLESEEFFNIKPLLLEEGEDGILYATPIPRNNKHAEGSRANAFALVKTSPQNMSPHKGEIIFAERL
jgi:molybdopterin molybdotransferase